MHRSGLVLAMLALGAGGAVACGFGGGSARSNDRVATPPRDIPGVTAAPSPGKTFRLDEARFPVTLEVSGDANADITYAPGSGQPPTRISAATPWTKTLQLSQSDVVLLTTLTARTSSTSAKATITCRIKIAGALVAAKTASGPHALADCSTA